MVLVGFMCHERQPEPDTEPCTSPWMTFVKVLVAASNRPYSSWTPSTLPVLLEPHTVISANVCSLLSYLTKLPSVLVTVFATASLLRRLEDPPAEAE